MAKVKLDVCDVCDDVIALAKEGVEISGENIMIAWVGRGSPPGDLFKDSGIHIPMNGRVTLTACKKCLVKELELTQLVVTMPGATPVVLEPTDTNDELETPTEVLIITPIDEKEVEMKNTTTIQTNVDSSVKSV